MSDACKGAAEAARAKLAPMFAALREKDVEVNKATAKLILKRAIKQIEKTGLRDGMQWGDDAMESFNYGKKRSIDAIKHLMVDEGLL